jgi:hypothetical protein
MAKDLSPAKCILLTIHYASEGNINALHSFTPTRLDALDPELVLRILLTYLPESLDPKEYRQYVSEVASRLYFDVDREDVEVDITPIKDIDEEHAKRKVKRLKLLEIGPPTYPPHAPKDLLTRFLCHRAYRIDTDTGLLNLVTSLVEPFLDRNEFLRTWFISVVLPLLRLEFEYYSETENVTMALRDFEQLQEREGIDFLMQPAAAEGDAKSANGSNQRGNVARDIKGLVGPWMYGYTDRKRRRLNYDNEQEQQETTTLSNGMNKVALQGVSAADKTGHEWEYMYRWLVFHARDNFPIAVHAVEDWDGPGDVDLGGLDTGNADRYLDEEVQSKLEAQYAQAAFASCYAAQADTEQTIRGAHTVLARLAELLDFIPPPDLATSVDSLPKIERHAVTLDESQTVADLEPDALLKPEHPLTTPRLETYMLLQMMVYSAYQFSGLGYPISLANVAKLHLYASKDEQLAALQKILRGLSRSGARKDETQWTADRAKLMWLWNWGIDSTDDEVANGPGVLGNIRREKFEEEMLKCFTETSCKYSISPLPTYKNHYAIVAFDSSFFPTQAHFSHQWKKWILRRTQLHWAALKRTSSRFRFEAKMSKPLTKHEYIGYDLAINLYLKSASHPLPPDTVEQIVMVTAMEAYDSATNGNKTRGGMKKANDM